MQERPKFVVRCERIKKQSRYRLSFRINETMISRIKALPSEQRRFNTHDYSWELTTKGLYNIIKIYKGSNKLLFDFGTYRDIFYQQIKKIDADEAEKKRIIIELEKNKIIWNEYKAALELDHSHKIEEVHRNLKEGTKLFPFQVVSAVFLNEVRNALLSLEMGLGKTISTIAYIEMNDFNKIFVITPNSLKHNFFHEVEKFTNSKAHIINWRKNKYSFEESKYIIVNYEYFNTKLSKKMDKKFADLDLGKIDSLICDESHRLKNTKSNTYKNFKRIFKKDVFVDEKESKIFLSGTPAPNRAHELYTILNQISPVEFPTKKDFFEIYCGMYYDPEVQGGWVTNFSAMNLEELYNKVTPYTYRKRKQDVLKDLPDKIYQRIILDLTSEEERQYNEIEAGVANEIINEYNSNPLTIMIRLRQFTSSLKIKHIKEVVDRLLEEGQKIVIVDMFKDILYELHELYPDVSTVHTGDQTVEERSAIVEDFQDPNGKTQIFLGSIQTCNYGLTLTAASRLFIITLPYSVGEYDQVSDRLHRIGQKDTVNIYPLIFSDTIDDYVFKIIESKRKEINKVIDNEDYESNVDESVIGELIKRLKEKYGESV